MVADCLTWQYEDLSAEASFFGLVLQHLPEVFQSIRDHQKKDPYCKDLYPRVIQADPTVRNFKLFNGTLVYNHSRAKAKRYLLPDSLSPQSFLTMLPCSSPERSINNLCFSSGIRHITTSPYYPQASQVECFIRNLKASLVIYHNSKHTHWNELLSSLAITFNSAWHESTAATPASLFLGRELNHPLGLKWHLYELKLQKDSKGVNDFWVAALSNLRKACARVVDRYNALRRQAVYQVGDFVLIRLHPASSKWHQRSAKLGSVYTHTFLHVSLKYHNIMNLHNSSSYI
jgi:hypothetical protein